MRIIFAAFLIILVLVGCGEMPRELPPTIVELTSSSPVVVQNRLVTLSSSVVGLDEELNYLWEASGGEIIGEGYEVRWRAPDSDGIYEIKLTVTDPNGNTDSEEIRIKVVDEFNIIIPGVQAGGIRIGESFGSVRRKYGEPDIEDVFYYPEMGVIGIYYLEMGVIGIASDINENDQLDDCDIVDELFVGKPYSGVTEEGIGIGSSREEWERVFGPPGITVSIEEMMELKPAKIEGEFIIYPQGGIGAIFLKELVEVIYIF